MWDAVPVASRSTHNWPADGCFRPKAKLPLNGWARDTGNEDLDNRVQFIREHQIIPGKVPVEDPGL